VLVKFGTTTLGDDANHDVGGKIAVLLEDLGADSQVQVTPLVRGTVPFKAARGNVDGKLSFSAGQSFADREAMLTFVVALFALMNTTADLTLQEGATTLKCAGAILRGFTRDKGTSTGVRLGVVYRFELTSLPVIA
jgi:hypothetical protein